MAEFLDGNQEPQLADGEEYQTLTESLESASDSIEQTDDQDVPDKYKGKSAAELVRMHQEAEKMAGRQ